MGKSEKMMHLRLNDSHLRRRAAVYVRQSSLGQVLANLESQRRQYALADQARELGFREVIVIDDDLGRSGSGLVDRPGFQRLVAEVCAGEVGAVFCIEASRLARNGRDWHQLVELCGMAGTVLVDADGIYDPRVLNDRLLLGLKGTMSEFELGLLRQRSHEAIRQKAGRGELRMHLPVGYCWLERGKMEMDPDHRVQQALRLVFSKMTDLGSVRQVLLWVRRESIQLPVKLIPEGTIVWRLPTYSTVRRILSSPVYAGVYAFGRTKSRTKIVNGRSQKTSGHRCPTEEWQVLIRDHHPGYITWEQYEHNQSMISANAHSISNGSRKAGRGGQALLSGLLRCRRCGWMLQVHYTQRTRSNRYGCVRGRAQLGEHSCISFGAWRVDQAVAAEILGVINGNAVDAAIEAVEQMRRQEQEHRKALELELEQARYEAALAARRYEAVDPDNRLVAGQLEARWNKTLENVCILERKLQTEARERSVVPIPDRELLLSLAQDLHAVWNSPAADMRLKQRIVRIVLQEIIADIDLEHEEIVLLLHWVGGRHSELRVRKNPTGQNRYRTAIEACDVIRQMTGRFNDERIAATLNRIGLGTGAGNAWNEQRVNSFRHKHQLVPKEIAASDVLTIDQAADRLGVSKTSVRRMIGQKLLAATQVIRYAPWEIRPETLDSAQVRLAMESIRRRERLPRTKAANNQDDLFSIS
jgi:excisionase family DNA binding protein